MTYKNQSKYLQGIADGHNAFQFAHGDEVITDHQKRDILKSKITSIEKRLAELPANDIKRKQLGREKAVIQAQLSELKVFSDRHGIDRFFIQAAKEILSQGQFNIVMGEAVKMLKRYKELEYTVPENKLSDTTPRIKKEMAEAVKEFIAKGNSITKVPPVWDKRTMMNCDPQVMALTDAQKKIYKKLKRCGICKEDALREAQKP